MSKKILLLLILLEGYATIAVEILSIRQMVPYVGSNVLNTSIIIGIFLLALAGGYFRGGKVGSDFLRTLLINLILVLGILSFGFSNLFLNYLFGTLHGIIGLVTFSIVIMGPIVYWLGQTVPILTNLVKHQRSGEVAGELLFVSTFGSFTGSILTSALIINFFGVETAVLTLIGVICTLLFVLAWNVKAMFMRSISVAAILILVALVLNKDITYLKTNNYSSVNVYSEANKKYFIINHSISSMIANNNANDAAYIKMIRAGIDSIAPKKSKDILVLGAGGFAISLGDQVNRYTYVDIDGDLKTIAEKHFLHHPINGSFIPMDARAYLIANKGKKKSDIVVVDLFQNMNAIPAPFLTKEFYQDVANSLQDDGYLYVNTIAVPGLKDKFSRHLKNTIETSFACNSMLSEYNKTESLQNIVYVCSKKQGDEVIYTDSKTNLIEVSTH